MLGETYQQQEERETWQGIVDAERSSTERAGYRRLVAKYAGTCDSCAGAVAKGQPILYNRRHELRLLCLDCGARADAGEELERHPDAPERLTTRERRERRLEKRREWAASRSSSASSEHARATERASIIPFGQPILVGHYSEGRDRRYRAGIARGFERSFEHADAANRHEQAARGLEEQLATSIYDDDPDAIERLKEKLAGLEGKRERMKAANAAYRREHKAELAGMTPYERSQNVPHPAYELQNLGGNITRTRQRLERLRRQKGA